MTIILGFLILYGAVSVELTYMQAIFMFMSKLHVVCMGYVMS